MIEFTSCLRCLPTFVGKFSIEIIFDNAIMPDDVIKIVKDSESSGTQLKLLTSQSLSSKYRYPANESNPTIEPHKEMADGKIK